MHCYISLFITLFIDSSLLVHYLFMSLSCDVYYTRELDCLESIISPRIIQLILHVYNTLDLGDYSRLSDTSASLCIVLLSYYI